MFVYLILPGVYLSGLVLTLTAGGWGSRVRSRGEKARDSGLGKGKALFNAVLFVALTGVVAGAAARWMDSLADVPVLWKAVIEAASIAAAACVAWKITANGNGDSPGEPSMEKKKVVDGLVYAWDLTPQDRLLLQNMSNDIQLLSKHRPAAAAGSVGSAETANNDKTGAHDTDPVMDPDRDARDIAALKALNDPKSSSFEPTVFSSVDVNTVKLHPLLDRFLFRPYIRWAQTVVRHPTDVVMLNHLLLYLFTSLPSALYLFYHFTYLHGIIHVIMQGSYVGAYTLLMHQHIHMRGVLAKKFPLTIIDQLFPYITDPLMGHTWNSYFYHHVKHHHVEGNGPGDLSSTIRYQRDNVWHFLHYVGRFFLFVWIELPCYFFRRGRTLMGFQAGFWELSNMAFIATLAIKVDWRPTLFVFILPLTAMRVGLMVGNWGQHAFVDADEPDSDFRSSITLIDVPSNRYCYNDGYHTSHHLNPLRHWRDHPVSFLQQKATYAREGALVFHDIDYIMITVKLLQRDYAHLARCLVPMGAQVNLTMDERAAMLERHTRRFTEEEIRAKFRTAAQ